MKKMEDEKKAMRRAVKKEVESLSSVYCRQADSRICEKAVALLEYERAKTVFCYVGTAREIDTRPILQDILAKGKRLGVPKCISKGVMEVYCVEDLDDLEEGAYGIMEPGEGCHLIAPSDIDLAFVPCLCCSKTGQRLGYGGGYYDRYLEKADFTKAVLCRGKLIKVEIPADVHDVEMDLVISE